MNKYIEYDDIEINLFELGKYLLHKIVWILAVGIIFAGILGGYKYYSTKTADSDPEVTVKAEAEYELDLRKYEQESELLLVSDESTTSLVENHKDYLQNSLLMQLNPYHVWRAKAVVHVLSRDKDVSAGHIVNLYKQDLSGGSYLDDLAEEWGTDVSYLTELMVFNVKDDDRSAVDSYNNNVFRVTGEDQRILSEDFLICLYGDSEKNVQSLMNAVLDEVESARKRIGKEDAHEMTVTAGPCMEVVDTLIRDAQRDRMSYTSSLTYQIKDNTDKASLLSKPAENEAAAVDAGISKKALLKYGLIGFVVGAALMFLWLVFRYMTNDKLGNYRDLEQKGILLKELGSVTDQGIAMAAANIRNFAGERRKLFLTGMANEEQFRKTCEGIKEYLSEFEIVCARDVLHDPGAREQLVSCDAAILVEQKNVSCYSQMIEEITFVVNAEKEIVGIVII